MTEIEDDPYSEVKEDIEAYEKELAALKEKEQKFQDDFLLQQESPAVQLTHVQK